MKKQFEILKQNLTRELKICKGQISQKQLIREIEKICESIDNFISTSTVSDKLMVSVPWMQKFLTIIMNQYWSPDETSTKIEEENFRYKICLKLADSLFRLESEFKEYFNYDAPMPAILLCRLKQDIPGMYAKLNKHFRKLRINKKLRDIALYPFQRLMLPPAKNETINSWFFINEYYRYNQRFSGKDSQYYNVELAFLRSLIALNFNSQHIISYLSDYISGLLAGQKSVSDELSLLYKLDSGLANIYIKSEYYFKRNREPIKNIIEGIINKRICLCKLLLSDSVDCKQTSEECNDYIQTELTVKEIALLLRLLIDKGVIKVGSNMEIYKRISRNFRTPKKTEISIFSLENKYSTIDYETIEKVEKLLKNLLAGLKEVLYNVNLKEIKGR